MLRLFRFLVVGCSFSFMFLMGYFAPGAQAQSLYEDITHAFLPDDITYVMAGEIRVPIFESPSALPISRGAAIILADASPTGLSIGDARHLASLLNEKGWHAVVSPVSFTLEEEPDLPVDEAIHPKSDSRLQRQSYVSSSQHLTILINALNTHLESHQGFRMNIAYGMQAAQLLDLGSKGIIPSPDTLVAITPFWPNADINRGVPEFIAGTEFPVLDLSINDTLARTIITSVTTLLALLSIFILGGEILRGFSFAMILGVLIGTYSSIFVAAPILKFFKVTYKTLEKKDEKIVP